MSKETVFSKIRNAVGNVALSIALSLTDEMTDSEVVELDPRGLTLREPVAPIREALCDCKRHHNFQEVAINHCFDCNKPLHS